MQKPYCTHVPIDPTAGSARLKSPSHGRASASSPRPRSAMLSGPNAGLKIQRQVTPTTTMLRICGRNRPARKRARPGSFLRPSREASTRPMKMGTML